MSMFEEYGAFKITASVLFCLLLYKGICCGYPFEWHRLFDEVQKSIHNICFFKKIRKTGTKNFVYASFYKSFADHVISIPLV